MARRVEAHDLPGPAGTLEALLEEPAEGDPSFAALVCHPHPLYGGTMHNKVVFRLARGLRRAGAVVLRFNFRGVGRSQGEHGHFEGEIEDARTALLWLRERYPHLPPALAGFSFGSRVITRLGCEIGDTRLLLAAGFPTRMAVADYLPACPIPKVFIQSTHDEHAPKEEIERLFARFAHPKRLVWVVARDHFFAGGLDELEERVREAGAGLAQPAIRTGRE
jgi:uncharacterized protein